MARRRAVHLFLMGHLLLAVPLGILLLSTQKLELHRAVNNGDLAFADTFLRAATHLGDGLVPTVLAVVLLFARGMRPFLMMALGCGVSAIIVQVLKRTVYAGMDRPFMYADELSGMHWVPGLELHHHFSFPSGHSAAAFSMAMALTAIVGRRGWAMLLLAGAVMVAFSRVHLSQHFLQDVLVGSVIGTAISYLVYRCLYHSQAPAWTRGRPVGDHTTWWPK